MLEERLTGGVGTPVALVAANAVSGRGLPYCAAIIGPLPGAKYCGCCNVGTAALRCGTLSARSASNAGAQVVGCESDWAAWLSADPLFGFVEGSGVVTLAVFAAGVAAAGGGCFPVTGYSNQEKSPSRFGRLAVEPWWESSANALPHARNIPATTATPNSTLAARHRRHSAFGARNQS